MVDGTIKEEINMGDIMKVTIPLGVLFMAIFLFAYPIYADGLNQLECHNVCNKVGMSFKIVQASSTQMNYIRDGMFGDVTSCRCQTLDNGTLIEKWTDA
jgi:hypothetical protein